jgi:hypothetical protein
MMLKISADVDNEVLSGNFFSRQAQSTPVA